MFCNKCGREVSDTAKFCNYCGNRLGADTSLRDTKTNVNEHIKPMKLKINKKVLIVAALAVVVVVIGIMGYKLYTSPTAEMNRAIKSGNYSTALEIYEDELEDDELTSKTLKLLNTSLAELQAEYETETLSYEEMVESLDLLSNFDDTDFNALVSATRENVENQHKVANLTATADEYLQSEKYTAAIDTYNSALAIDPTAEAALAGLEQARNEYRSALLDSAAEYEEKGDYSSALNTLENGSRYLESDSVLLSEIDAINKRYEAYQQEQINGIIDQANLLANQGNWTDALNLLEQQMEIYSDETLQETYNDIKEKIPVTLSNFQELSSGIIYVAEGTQNELGIIYKDGIIFDASLNVEEIYELDGKYTSFSGTAFVDERASDGKQIALEIYLDNELVFSKYGIANDDIFDFAVDLTGVNQMKIVTYNEGSFSCGYLVFINTVFERNT